MEIVAGQCGVKLDGQTTENTFQMPLLGAVLEALMEGNEEEPELLHEDIGLALLHLKTVIDCLDQ
jgi:hypothetical protein